MPSLAAQWLPGMSVTVPLCISLALFPSLHTFVNAEAGPTGWTCYHRLHLSSVCTALSTGSI